MVQMQIAQAKARFSDVLHQVEAGQEVIIIRGAKQEAVAAIIPIAEYRALKERKLGSLSHWGPIRIDQDWAMTDEELLAS